jgi:putative transposase
VARYPIAVHGYALLDNEVQLLLTPETAEDLSRTMQALSHRHGTRFNLRYGHTGTVWAGRFRASVVDPNGWVAVCLRYIETARARAHIAQPALWSSAEHHLGGSCDSWIREHEGYWSLGNTPFDREVAWRSQLEMPLTVAELNAVEAAARGGWAIGSEQFRMNLSRQVSRRLGPGLPGRPRKISVPK